MACVALLLAVVLAYEPAMDGAFMIDDEHTIFVDAGIRRVFTLVRFLRYNRPVTEFGYALTWAAVDPGRGCTTSASSPCTR